MADRYVFRKEELKLNPYIFRVNDIRGIFEKDFDEEDCKVIGRAYGTWLQEKGKDSVCLGIGVRLTSPKIHDAALEGLLSTGIKVFDLGMVTTPMTYLAPLIHNSGGAVMVTASHLPMEWNGFKLSFEDRTIFGDEIQEVRKIAERKTFKKLTSRFCNRSVSFWYHFQGRNTTVIFSTVSCIPVFPMKDAQIVSVYTHTILKERRMESSNGTK